MTEKKYKYWLAVVDGQTVRFSDLAHMIAAALHPEGEMNYAAARLNLETELKQAVRDGVLKPRNPAGLGRHTFPVGDALQRAVFNPKSDLREFLEERGIELRITPYGNGPEYWTLENSAAAMQEQLNWHDGTRAEFQDQMQEAAQSGALVVLNPQTCLPYRPDRVRTYWEYVTPDSVNAWLATLKAPYRWTTAPPLVTVPHKSLRDFKPWETLVPFYEPINGLYMYQQAAREIADAEGWDNSKLEALWDEMATATNSGTLPIRSRKTGAVIPPNSPDALSLVTVDDVNEWLTRTGRPYRWKLQISAAPDATKPPEQTQALTTNEIAQLFDGIAFAQDRWVKNIGQAKWLASANRGKGEQGGAQATWCPLTIAQLVYGREKDTRAKQKTLRSLNSRFRANPVLKPWKDAWDDYYGMFTEPGEA